MRHVPNLLTWPLNRAWMRCFSMSHLLEALHLPEKLERCRLVLAAVVQGELSSPAGFRIEIINVVKRGAKPGCVIFQNHGLLALSVSQHDTRRRFFYSPFQHFARNADPVVFDAGAAAFEENYGSGAKKQEEAAPVGS